MNCLIRSFFSQLRNTVMLNSVVFLLSIYYLFLFLFFFYCWLYFLWDLSCFTIFVTLKLFIYIQYIIHLWFILPVVILEETSLVVITSFGDETCWWLEFFLAAIWGCYGSWLSEMYNIQCTWDKNDLAGHGEYIGYWLFFEIVKCRIGMFPFIHALLFEIHTDFQSKPHVSVQLQQ